MGMTAADINDMKAAFTIFDKNLKGAITKQTLKTFYSQFGQTFTDEDIEAMIIQNLELSDQTSIIEAA